MVFFKSPSKLKTTWLIYRRIVKYLWCADSLSQSSFHQRDEELVESDELEEDQTFDDTLSKFEMLGVGCVRGGSTSEKKDKEGGILRSENIVKLGFEWRSCMVVLSACNTAKGCVSTCGSSISSHFLVTFKCNYQQLCICDVISRCWKPRASWAYREPFWWQECHAWWHLNGVWMMRQAQSWCKNFMKRWAEAVTQQLRSALRCWGWNQKKACLLRFINGEGTWCGACRQLHYHQACSKVPGSHQNPSHSSTGERLGSLDRLMRIHTMASTRNFGQIIKLKSGYMPFFSKPWWEKNGHVQYFSELCWQMLFFSECWYFQPIWSQKRFYCHKTVERVFCSRLGWRKMSMPQFKIMWSVQHFIKKMEMKVYVLDI